MQGSDWNLHNNTKDGLFIDKATVIVDGLNLSSNGESGAHVYDARYVTFENLTDRIGKQSNFFEGRRDALKPVVGQPQAVDHGRGQAVSWSRFDVLFIGGNEFRGSLADQLS